MKAYKGFNKDMTCRGFQYEEGKEYECDEARICESGFHACEAPLDCFSYYFPSKSVYHEVEIEDNGERQSEDTKVVGKKIKIGAKLSLPAIASLHVEWVKSKIEKEKTNNNTGNCSAATNTGDCSAATNTGDCSAAEVTGQQSVAINIGKGGKAKAGIGSAIVLVLRNNDYEIVKIKSFKIDGKRYKPDTWYTLDENGKVVKAE